MPGPSDEAVRESLVVGEPDGLSDAVTRAHLSDGRCVGWRGDVPHGVDLVLDAELGDRPPPEVLGRRFGLHDFWERWTRAECAAKLTDVPILHWVKAHGLAVPPGVMESVTLSAHWLAPGLVVSVAWRGHGRLGRARPATGTPVRTTL